MFEEQAGKKRGVHKITRKIRTSKKVIIHSFDKAMEVIRPGMEGYKAPGLAKVDGWDGSTGANALFKQKCLELFHGSQTEATKKETYRERERGDVTILPAALHQKSTQHTTFATAQPHSTAQHRPSNRTGGERDGEEARGGQRASRKGKNVKERGSQSKSLLLRQESTFTLLTS